MTAVPSAEPTRSWSRSQWLAALAAAGLACILYAYTLGGTFIYDDVALVRDDPLAVVPGEWVAYLRQPYFPYAPDPLWRPLPSMSLALQQRLHGPRAWAFHLVNVLLHAGCAALVAELGRRMTGRPAVAWAGGLLFAAHPVHVEAVALIVGRAESMCTAAVVGGLVLFHAARMSGPRIAGILVCYVAAVLCKEHGVLLGPMLLACHVGRRRSSGAPPIDRGQRSRLLVLAAGCCFVILAYVSYRESIMPIVFDKWFMRWTVNPVVRAQGLDRALLPLVILGRYAMLLAFPWKLSPDYGANVITYFIRWDDPYYYVGLAALVAYVPAVVLAWRRRSPMLAPLLCIAIAYALISNAVFIIGTVMGDRLIYLASTFFILLAADLLTRLRTARAAGLLALLLGLASVRTVTYAARWDDAVELFATARAEFPRSVYLHVLEAAARFEEGQVHEADAILAEARRLEPESQNVWAWSEVVARRLRRHAEADVYEGKAFELNEYPPHMPERWGPRPQRRTPASAPASAPTTAPRGR